MYDCSKEGSKPFVSVIPSQVIFFSLREKWLRVQFIFVMSYISISL